MSADISKSHSRICQLVEDSLLCQYPEIKISLYPELPHRIANMTLDKSVNFYKIIRMKLQVKVTSMGVEISFLFALRTK